MGAVNVTVRVEEETKREFDVFCENVGMNITTAFNMFIKATLRNRQLPFIITDIDIQELKRASALARGREAFREAQQQSVVNGTDSMTMDEIDTIISEVRREKQGS